MMKNREIQDKGKNLLENLITAFLSGDVISINKCIVELSKTPTFIKEAIFYQNLETYLSNTCADGDNLRKFAAILAEGENAEENAKRIIKIIDDIGTRAKAIYISNLTRACCVGLVDTNKFFKLAQCIVRLTDEDLIFLRDNIKKGIINTDEEYLDDFRYCGLMKEVTGGFAYTKRAYELKKYALWYGHTIEIPQIPERQILEFASKEDIKKLFEEEIENITDFGELTE